MGDSMGVGSSMMEGRNHFVNGFTRSFAREIKYSRNTTHVSSPTVNWLDLAGKQARSMPSLFSQVRDSKLFIRLVWINNEPMPNGVCMYAHFCCSKRHIEKNRVVLFFILFAACASEDAREFNTYTTGVLSCENCRSVEFLCQKKWVKISEMIYGVSFNARKNRVDENWLFELNPSARRWGGNPTSRYNWEINSWNTGADWYFTNTVPSKSFSFEKDYIEDNNKRSIVSYVTLPMLGWVAKDAVSGSFPVFKYGDQDDQLSGGVVYGNGLKNGARLRANPLDTSKLTSVESLSNWIAGMSSRSLIAPIFALGNEPMLWGETHRDVHSEPTSYEEVMDKSIALAKLVKDKTGSKVSGPSVWGWTAYFYSDLDLKNGLKNGPDQKRFSKPFLSWYLEEFKKYEERYGKRLLDYLDVHYYPQAKGVFMGSASDHGEKRWRSTRSLWDREYVDESWINEPVYLIPRMKQLIGENYPGTGLVIGEYSFGDTQDISGALAVAEALGVFAEYNVQAAFYWLYPKRYSPAYWGFRIFRNFDGNGGKFHQNLISTYRESDYSEYVSVGDDLKSSTAVLINKSSNDRYIRLHPVGCGDIKKIEKYSYGGGSGIVKSVEGEYLKVGGRSVSVVSVYFSR